MRTLFIILFIMACTLGVQAQDVRTDFNAINHAMSSDAYSAVIEYKSFTDNVQDESAKTTINVKESKYKMSLPGITKINNQNLSVTVDEMRKLIIVDRPDTRLQALRHRSLPLDSFLKGATSVTFSKPGNNTGRYLITLSGFKEKSIELDFDLSGFRLKRVYFIFAEKETDAHDNDHEKAMEISYLSFNTSTLVNDALFDISPYIIKKKGTYTATGKYAGYTIINLIKPE